MNFTFVLIGTFTVFFNDIDSFDVSRIASFNVPFALDLSPFQTIHWFNFPDEYLRFGSQNVLILGDDDLTSNITCCNKV